MQTQLPDLQLISEHKGLARWTRTICLNIISTLENEITNSSTKLSETIDKVTLDSKGHSRESINQFIKMCELLMKIMQLEHALTGQAIHERLDKVVRKYPSHKQSHMSKDDMEVLKNFMLQHDQIHDQINPTAH